MVRCEYLTIDLANLPARTDEVDALNEAGEQGWELIAIMSDHVAYLRRQVDSDNLADGPADRSDRGAAAGRGVIAGQTSCDRCGAALNQVQEEDCQCGADGASDKRRAR